jgi:hypothetical protein
MNKTYYYLLYKLRSHPTLWIIDESDNKFYLINKIKKIKSNEEVYYLVEKEHTVNYIKDKLDSKLKKFVIFKMDSKCKLIHNSI